MNGDDFPAEGAGRIGFIRIDDSQTLSQGVISDRVGRPVREIVRVGAGDVLVSEEGAEYVVVNRVGRNLFKNLKKLLFAPGPASQNLRQRDAIDEF